VVASIPAAPTAYAAPAPDPAPAAALIDAVLASFGWQPAGGAVVAAPALAAFTGQRSSAEPAAVIGTPVAAAAGPNPQPKLPVGANGVTGVQVGHSQLEMPGAFIGDSVAADWYFPTQADDKVSANGVVWLQRGDTVSMSELAAKIAGQTNSIVVVPVISSFEIPNQPGRYLGSPEMQKAVADMMLGDRVALSSSATAAGYQRVLPQKFLFAGERLGGGFAAEVAARTVDNGAAKNLLGVVMFDGLANPDQFPTSLAKLENADIPLYQIASPPQAGNNWGSTTEQLLAFHPDQFFGVQLYNGSAMSAAAITLATGWINAGTLEAFKQRLQQAA
jgi:hypothetical protein